MYDEHFAEQRQRKKIDFKNFTDCRICKIYANSASDYEWPCLILRDWICETHCCETKLIDYEDTRNKHLNIINEKIKSPFQLLEICKKCPYYDY